MKNICCSCFTVFKYTLYYCTDVSFYKVNFFVPLWTLPFLGLQFEFINPIFEFSKGMNDLHLDEAEYALLIAINIFSAGQNS